MPAYGSNPFPWRQYARGDQIAILEKTQASIRLDENADGVPFLWSENRRILYWRREIAYTSIQL